MLSKQLSAITGLWITIITSSDAALIDQPDIKRQRGGFFKPEAFQISRANIGRGGSAISDNDAKDSTSSDVSTNTRTTSAHDAIESAPSDPYSPDEQHENDTIQQSSPPLKSSSSSSSQTFIPSQTTTSTNTYPLSICSIQGKRQYMEDEYFTNQNGSFCSVMDGHGGSAVSRYLRQNLYARYLQAKASTISKYQEDDSTETKEHSESDDDDTDSEITSYDEGVHSGDESDEILEDGKHIISDKLSGENVTSILPPSKTTRSKDNILSDGATLQACIKALKSAFEKIDAEVQRISHWSFQGSTTVAIKLHKIPSTGQTLLISANVGDSRAILSRAGTAIDLTKDHKPNDPMERARIESLGGRVDWFGPVDKDGKPLKRKRNGCYRINRNLALSRAIGDRSELPFVSSKVDIEQIPLEEDNDEFVILASDGLWDVFDKSQDVVNFCHNILQKARSNTDDAHVEQKKRKPDSLERVRRKMSKLLVREALRRGSMDNITVIIVWLTI